MKGEIDFLKSAGFIYGGIRPGHGCLQGLIGLLIMGKGDIVNRAVVYV
jgi:hypothetical protein